MRVLQDRKPLMERRIVMCWNQLVGGVGCTGDPFSVFRCRGTMNYVGVCHQGLNPPRAIKIPTTLVSQGS